MDSEFNKVVHDQINNSPSKQFYSIPKEPRFHKQIKKSYCSVAFYDLPSSFKSQQRAFGYGNKLDFTKSDKNLPSPNHYELSSTFETNKRKSKGATFSFGRDKVKFMGIKYTTKNPGPGTYDYDKASKQLKFTLAKKLPNFAQFSTTKYNPGPGTYESLGISKDGFYFVAKTPGTQAPIFSPTSGNRFKPEFPNLQKNPPPGKYEAESINEKCHYTNSKMRSAAGGRFSIGDRFYAPQTKLKVPGPGSYDLVSEFGDIDFPQILSNKTSTNQRYKTLQNSMMMRQSSNPDVIREVKSQHQPRAQEKEKEQMKEKQNEQEKEIEK